VTDLVVRLAFLGLFAYWSIELVRPFVPVVIWAVVLAAALYPAYAWLARRLGRHSVAAVLVTLLVLATVLGPISVLAASLVQTVQVIVDGLQAGTLRVPPPPARVADWPLVGEQVHEAWALGSSNLEDAIERYGAAVLPAGGTILAGSRRSAAIS
jgi:predicted PurR-regulated permease PerM